MAILYYYWTENDNSEIIPVYDANRYELVEKKDWKITNLKEQIDVYKKEEKDYEEMMLYYSKLIRNCRVEIENLSKELEELKKD